MCKQGKVSDFINLSQVRVLIFFSADMDEVISYAPLLEEVAATFGGSAWYRFEEEEAEGEREFDVGELFRASWEREDLVFASIVSC